jgi:hypothetical protein
VSLASQTRERAGGVGTDIQPSRGPLRWIGRADDRLVDAMLLALLVIGASSLYTIYALRVSTFQPDEWYYMELARVIAGHFPSGIWQHGIYWRGIQRIDQLVLAAPFALLRGASVYEVAHAIQALLYASTAIPVWLLVRATGLPRWARALAATIALATPWAIVSTSFLAESAAYPAYAWALYATWRAVRSPSYGRELLAIAALIVAALSRTALLGMAPLLPLAALWQQWSWELRGRRRSARLRALPRQLWSQHRIITAITVLAVLSYLLSAAGALPGGGVAALTGNYGIPSGAALAGLLSRWDYYLSRMVIGTGGIAFAFGFAWALRQLVRPEEGRRHALAVVCVLGVVVVLLSLLQAGTDERYVLYGAVPIGVAFVAELASAVEGAQNRDRWARLPTLLGLAAATGVAILLVDRASWPPIASEYDFFTYPAATFYNRVVLTRLAGLPLESGLTLIALAGAAVAWALLSRRRASTRIAVPAVALIVLALCVTQLGYALQKFTGSGAGGVGGPSAAQRSWLERIVPPGVKVAAVGIGLGQSGDYLPIWRTSEFWNTSIQLGASFQPWGIPTVPFDTLGLVLGVHSPSGRLDIATPSAAEVGHRLAVPRYMLLPTQATNPMGFAAKAIADDPYLPLTLVRLSSPARLEWAIGGTSLEGFMAPHEPATVTVYGNALSARARCASFELIGPPAFAGRWPFTVISGDTAVHGDLVALQTRTIDVRLHPTAVGGGRLATVTIHVHGKVPYPNGSVVSARVAGFAVGACDRGA